MARPKTPSNVLEMRGSFTKDPQRRRADAEGVGAFNREPPQHLAQEYVRAWHDIVSRLPAVAIYATDEIAVELCAQLLTMWRVGRDMDALKEYRQWAGKLGLSPQDRTKLEPMQSAKKNEFDDL